LASAERVARPAWATAGASSRASFDASLDARLVLEALYHDPRGSRPIDARLVLDGSGRVLVNGAGIDAEWPVSALRVEPPILGGTLQAVLLPNGAKCETRDQRALDLLRQLSGRPAPFTTIYRWEQSWPGALAAAGLVVLVLITSYVWLIPWGAASVARAVPSLAQKIGYGTMALLDSVFDESELPAAERDRLRNVFERVTADHPGVRLRLAFRKARVANAFALPDGTVVLTDELVRLADHPDQLEAVLWHEAAHVAHGHGLRRVLESSVFAALAMAYYGDSDLVTAIAGGLPLVYAKSRYSRAEELEADGVALDAMRRHRKDPRHFARILAALERQRGGESRETQYFSSHPATQERIERFERAGTAP
jgi:Zn-dependent protease with chaperone function